MRYIAPGYSLAFLASVSIFTQVILGSVLSLPTFFIDSNDVWNSLLILRQFAMVGGFRMQRAYSICIPMLTSTSMETVMATPKVRDGGMNTLSFMRFLFF